VLGGDHLVVGPAEEFLEFLRVQGTSPNTVKSYARALALWWSYLTAFGLEWDSLALSDVGGFLAWLRSGDGPDVISIEPRPSRFAESTVGTRLQAVLSCYRFHEMNGVTLGRDLVRVVNGGRSAYKPMLEHVAKADERRQGNTAHLQLVDQLFEVNRPAGLLRRMDVNVPVLADRKVPLAPSADLVQLGCIRRLPRFSDFVCGTP